MPTEFKNRTIKKKVKCLNIPFDDLVSKLEKIAAEHSLEITGTNKKMSFADLSDIKAHPESFFGDPKIKIGDISVDFYDGNAEVFLIDYETIPDEHFDIANNLFQFLEQYQNKSYFFVYKNFLSILIYGGGIVFGVMMLASFEILKFNIMILYLYLGILAISYSVIFLQSRQNTVQFFAKQTFWRMNKNEIIRTLLIAAIVGVVSFFAKDLLKFF